MSTERAGRDMPRPFYVWKQRDPLTGITSIAPMWRIGLHLRIAWHRFRFWTWVLRGY